MGVYASMWVREGAADHRESVRLIGLVEDRVATMGWFVGQLSIRTIAISLKMVHLPEFVFQSSHTTCDFILALRPSIPYTHGFISHPVKLGALSEIFEFECG